MKSQVKISKILKEKEAGISFEFFPPRNEKSKGNLVETIKILKEYKPLYTSMTCGAGGTTQSKTKDAVQLLLDFKDLVVMPHVTCLCSAKSEIEDVLNQYQERGIVNIMALRGDPPTDVGDDGIIKGDFSYAQELVRFIKERFSFDIGAAVYPEGHIEMSSLAQDLEFTKQKIDSGVEFAVTQMFFDNTYFYKLIDRMRTKGIDIPVLPGILPLTNVSKVKKFASICRSTIPKHIEEAMSAHQDNLSDMIKVGIDFTIKQCQDLKKNGFKQLHFFTLNKPLIMKAILDAI